MYVRNRGNKRYRSSRSELNVERHLLAVLPENGLHRDLLDQERSVQARSGQRVLG